MESRTNLTIKNIFASYLSVVPSTILNVLTRYIFIRYISVEYLGASGLFSSIFALMSFADLGIGEAITFQLYKPLANKDKTQVSKLMNFYKKFYLFLIILIFVAGLCCIPFLPQLTNHSTLPNLTLIYILFLINTMITYYSADKKSFLIANQEGYISTFLLNAFICVQYIIQMIVIVTTKNFIAYLLVQLVAQFLCGVATHIFVNTKRKDYYDFHSKEKLSIIEFKQLFLSSGALIFHKIGSILLDNFTNIIISSYLGLLVMGNYSNYIVVTNMCVNLLYHLTVSTQASIGNLCATTEDSLYKEKIMNRLEFFVYGVYALVFVELVVCFNDVILIYTGQLPFSNLCVFFLSLSLLVNGLRIIPNQFKTANGLFRIDCYRPILEALIYFVVGSQLVKYFNIEGLIVTMVTIKIFITCLVERIIVYKYIFKTNWLSSFMKFISRIVCTSILGITLSLLLNNLFVTNIFITLIIKGFIVLSAYSVLVIIKYHKNDDFQYYVNLIRGYIHKF